MDFAALLHFAERRGVFFAATDEKKATGFAVEAANQTEKLVGVDLAKVIDEGDGAIGPSGMNQKASRFIDDEKRGVLFNDKWRHAVRFPPYEISTTFFQVVRWP